MSDTLLTLVTYHAGPETSLEEIRRRPGGGVDGGRVPEGGSILHGHGLLPRVDLKSTTQHKQQQQQTTRRRPGTRGGKTAVNGLNILPQ